MTHRKDFENWMPDWAVVHDHGRWLVAYQMAAREGDTPGEPILFLKQAPRLWHAFFRTREYGMATTPMAALQNTDSFMNPKEEKQYVHLLATAPVELISQFGGLRIAIDDRS